MRFVKTLFLAALSVAVVVPGVAAARSSAAAFGSNGSGGWATQSTQKEADREAVKACNKGNAKKDCTVRATKAIARAEGDGRIGYGRSATSLADAKREALEGCGDKSCKVTFTAQTPGFFSLAKAEDDENGAALLHFSHGFADSDEADRVAMQRCQEDAGRRCKLVWWGAMPGTLKVDSAPVPVAAKPAAADCRPRTEVVRCSSQCTNGNCLVSYENGCKIRVQVAPVFDGFSNQWNYPAPSC